METSLSSRVGPKTLIVTLHRKWTGLSKVKKFVLLPESIEDKCVSLLDACR